MKDSKIEWTDSTWNPVRGCSIVSAGCQNCYAMKMAHRFSGQGLPYEGLTRLTGHGPVWTGKIMLVPQLLTVPLKTKKPTKFFVNSMSDLFHEAVPFDFIDRVFAVMGLSPQHTFQILTKRPRRMLEYFGSRENGYCDGPDDAAYEFIGDMHGKNGRLLPHLKGAGWGFYRCGEESELLYEGPLPFPNVWLGVSVENQQTANERIPFLLEVPAAVRFLSMEPLLGNVNLDQFFGLDEDKQWDGCLCHEIDPEDKPCITCLARQILGEKSGLHWVIVGGESGAGARPMKIEWLRSLRDQCTSAGVPFFFKQFGEWLPFGQENSYQGPTLKEYPTDGDAWKVGKHAAGRSIDGKTYDEFPTISTVAV